MKSDSDDVVDYLSIMLVYIYYLKCKDMVLSDFLTRMEVDKIAPDVVIPISFNSHSILTGHYYTFFTLLSETY